jgi:hypothetical protein
VDVPDGGRAVVSFKKNSGTMYPNVISSREALLVSGGKQSVHVVCFGFLWARRSEAATEIATKGMVYVGDLG